jgi:hypothetical protein
VLARVHDDLLHSDQTTRTQHRREFREIRSRPDDVAPTHPPGAGQRGDGGACATHTR